MTICENAEDSVASALMRASLLNMGQFDGGAIFEPLSARTYPYKALGRRTIGYVHNGIEIGLEGAYNTLLSGKPGEVKYVRKNKCFQYLRPRPPDFYNTSGEAQK